METSNQNIPPVQRESNLDQTAGPSKGRNYITNTGCPVKRRHGFWHIFFHLNRFDVIFLEKQICKNNQNFAIYSV